MSAYGYGVETSESLKSGREQSYVDIGIYMVVFRQLLHKFRTTHGRTHECGQIVLSSISLIKKSLYADIGIE